MNSGSSCSQIIVLIVVVILYKFNLDMTSKEIQNMFHSVKIVVRKTFLS